MMKLKHFITALLLIVAINFAPVIARAQTNDNPDDPDAPINVPFDGGVSLLIINSSRCGIRLKEKA
jgi:hypothetical protein